MSEHICSCQSFTAGLSSTMWDMTFHVTQSFIWKTLTWSNWKTDLLISSIFQMRKQAYWSKNNLPEVSSWLHTNSSLCSSGPVQSLPQKPQTAYSVITPALLIRSLEGSWKKSERNSGFSCSASSATEPLGLSSPECFSVWFPSLHQHGAAFTFSDVEEGSGIRQAGFTSQCWLLGHVS